MTATSFNPALNVGYSYCRNSRRMTNLRGEGGFNRPMKSFTHISVTKNLGICSKRVWVLRVKRGIFLYGFFSLDIIIVVHLT